MALVATWRSAFRFSGPWPMRAALVLVHHYVQGRVEAVVSKRANFIHSLSWNGREHFDWPPPQRFHQANVPTVPFCQCPNAWGFFSAPCFRKSVARILRPLSRGCFLISQAKKVQLKCLETEYIAGGQNLP